MTHCFLTLLPFAFKIHTNNYDKMTRPSLFSMLCNSFDINDSEDTTKISYFLEQEDRMEEILSKLKLTSDDKSLICDIYDYYINCKKENQNSPIAVTYWNLSMDETYDDFYNIIEHIFDELSSIWESNTIENRFFAK